MENKFKVELIPPLTKEQEVARYNATHEDSKMGVWYFDIDAFDADCHLKKSNLGGNPYYSKIIASLFKSKNKIHKNLRLYHRLKRNYGKR